MAKPRTEEQKRINARATRLFEAFKKDRKKLNLNDITSLRYPISYDDFGNNYFEDFHIYISFCEKIQKTFGKDKYFMWQYEEGSLVGGFGDYYDKMTTVKIGERSDSGNIRNGRYLVVGIAPTEWVEYCASHGKPVY